MNRVSHEILRSAETRDYMTNSLPMDYLTENKTKEEFLRREAQRETFLKNEAIAKNIIDTLPFNTRYTFRQQCPEDPSGEIEYQVVIKRKEEKKVIYGIENSKTVKSSNYLGFCLQSGLFIRDKQGNPIENQELIEKLSQNIAYLPQARQDAA